MAKQNKGDEGKKTGAKARSAIKSKKKAGATNKDIAATTNRSPDTIAAIESGRIKNPPSGLTGAIRKVKVKAKPKTKKK